jgi:predicted metal-dependent hydrolase
MPPTQPIATASPQVRNVRFGTGPEVPRHWHGGRRAITLFFDNLSLFFPPGERFFIASVKAHAAFATGTTLEPDVQAFCAQEGIHSREHVRYNRMLDAQGYPATRLEQRLERHLRWIARHVPLRRQLAITCALEHFTALMGDTVLSDPRLLDGANAEMAALWRWHAAEENEHKAVAFDLYQRAGGTYLERTRAMVGATIVFWILVLVHQVRLMKADGCAASLVEWRSLFVYLFVNPGGLRRIVGSYLKYYRPNFHPWQIDNLALLEAWRAGEGASRAGDATSSTDALAH